MNHPKQQEKNELEPLCYRTCFICHKLVREERVMEVVIDDFRRFLCLRCNERLGKGLVQMDA